MEDVLYKNLKSFSIAQVSIRIGCQSLKSELHFVCSDVDKMTIFTK